MGRLFQGFNYYSWFACATFLSGFSRVRRALLWRTCVFIFTCYIAFTFIQQYTLSFT
eukprot:XP_001709272.1 Hypothetical protein GL50803_35841 [Giardia lamblia ATCC 50803]